MIGFKFKAIDAGNFFNSERVMKALSEADRRVLSKFGAFVRQRAKSSIRPATVTNRAEISAARKAFRAGSGVSRVRKVYAASKPGEAPRSRQGDLRKLILFGYDPAERNVVIGPVLRGGKASETPGRLEQGGQFRHKKSGKIVRVQKRPYMKPAFDTEMKKMPGLWTGQLRG